MVGPRLTRPNGNATSRPWDVLLDVERIAPCMPGASVTSVADDAVDGQVKLGRFPLSTRARLGDTAALLAGTAAVGSVHTAAALPGLPLRGMSL
jgi:hypothetical protein